MNKVHKKLSHLRGELPSTELQKKTCTPESFVHKYHSMCNEGMTD